MDIEARVKVIEDKLDQTIEVLRRIEIGIYGDDKNRHSGVLDRQEATDKEIAAIQKRIQQIEDKNAEQDIALKSKKTLLTQGLEVVKWVGLAYLVLKGVFGFDTLFNKLF